MADCSFIQIKLQFLKDQTKTKTRCDSSYLYIFVVKKPSFGTLINRLFLELYNYNPSIHKKNGTEKMKSTTTKNKQLYANKCDVKLFYTKFDTLRFKYYFLLCTPYYISFIVILFSLYILSKKNNNNNIATESNETSCV